VLEALRQFADQRSARRRQALVQAVLTADEHWQAQSDDELLRSARRLRVAAGAWRLADEMLVEGFALVREASRRVHRQSHYGVQLHAGVVLADGGLAEMQTGEGKTLTALLPAFLYALEGAGCHVVTANDYLARRDADFAAAVFQRLGLRVGCIAAALPYERRGAEYAADVTYGAAREFGFDFLRDRLQRDALGADAVLQQRALHYALVDEADSVLIDDARTPLLIAVNSSQHSQEVDFYRWCDGAVQSLDSDRDLALDAPRRSIRLTDAGCRRIIALGRLPAWTAASPDRVFHQVEQSLTAHLLLRRDRDYIVADDGVGIVDPSTGRVAAGRKWRDGLQQAVEVKERLDPSASTAIAAKVAVQTYFRGYRRLSGMTGTARSCAAELRAVYRLPVTTVPTRLPCRRAVLRPRIFTTRAAKLAAVADEVRRRLDCGQSVLAGTPSVEASEHLSAALAAAGVAHEVLNCLRHEQEAKIIARAGRRGQATIATNMAGRGTDIGVCPEVLAAGGLHVIATEMHASARIDRQLAGRTARQGEPGSFQLMLSLDDDLFSQFPSARFSRAKRRAQQSPQSELGRAWIKWFRRAQRRCERLHHRDRRELVRLERARQKSLRDLGLDPLLEAIE